MALRERGIAVEAQHWLLRLPNGTDIRIDLSIPSLRWAIEIDVHADHLLLEGTAKDKQRDRQCHQIGWQVERVTPYDLAAFGDLIDELEILYQARHASISA